MTMTRVLLLLLFLPWLAWTDAATDAELRGIDAALQQVQQEQQSAFQQFQMVQELRRNELQAAYPRVIQNSPVYGDDNSPPNYEDVARDKQQRDDRIKQYDDQLNQLYARYQELEKQKAALVERRAQLLLPQ